MEPFKHIKYIKLISEVVNFSCTSALPTESQHVCIFYVCAYCSKPPVTLHKNFTISSPSDTYK